MLRRFTVNGNNGDKGQAKNFFYGEKISICSFLVVLLLFLFFQRIPFSRLYIPFSFDVIFLF